MKKKSTKCSKQCSKASLNSESVVILHIWKFNWEQYKIVFLKFLAYQKSLASKDRPLDLPVIVDLSDKVVNGSRTTTSLFFAY